MTSSAFNEYFLQLVRRIVSSKIIIDGNDSGSTEKIKSYSDILHGECF